MRMKTKFVMLLLITFAMGVLIGALGHRASLRSHFERVAAFRENRTQPVRIISKIIEEKIQPSEEQRPKIKAILWKYSERIARFHEGQHHNIVMLLDSLKNELEPLLTPEQNAQLKRKTSHPLPGFGFPASAHEKFMHGHSGHFEDRRAKDE